MKKVAAIDLGTNTFHLLIAERESSGFREVLRERIWVSLAEDGIESFSDAVIERAINAIGIIKGHLEIHQVKIFRATGTEAFRSASNGPELLDRIEADFGINVEIISGEREAELIYKGTSLLFPGTAQPNIIMDIGGGSTEFVIYNDGGIIWTHSYKAGVTHLYNRFVASDPLSHYDHQKLTSYFDAIFVNFPCHLINDGNTPLIGASGSFEVLESFHNGDLTAREFSHFSLAEYYKVYDEIYDTSLEERLAHPNIPDNRAKLIVVAFVLIDYILKLTNPKEILVSPYALKEGLIKELLDI